MYTLGEKIIPRDIEEEIKDSYLSYAMSVIVGRALPDARDGLKPVHRRILYAMQELGLDPGKPYKKAARIVGECFVKDTLVLSQRGLIPIQSVERGDKVYTERGVRRVTELYEMPPQPLLEVILENGTRNIVTPSQQFRILTPELNFAWKAAHALTSSDYVVVRASYPALAEPVALQRIRPEDPNQFDEPVAYLLGFWLSDGWIEKQRGRVGFYSNAKPVIERIAAILRERFGLFVPIERKAYVLKTVDGPQERVGYQVRVSRDAFAQFLEANFGIVGWDAWTKHIPAIVFQSPRQVIWAFVSGLLDGDGSVHPRSNTVHYGSTSERLIDQLALLLQHNGVFTRRLCALPDSTPSIVNGRAIIARRRFYYLEVRGSNARLLARQLDVANARKRARLVRIAQARLKKTKHDVIPGAGEKIFTALSAHHLGSGWYQGADGTKFRQGIKYPAGTKIRYASELRSLPLRKSQITEWGIAEKLRRIGSPLSTFVDQVERDALYFFRVSSVAPRVDEATYDIQVEGDHQFIANGMVVHNCLGKYHPHGDVAVYDTLVRMVQDFSLRYPLVDGQGNFGSVDGDASAAMRYCVTGDALVVTDAGLVPIRELSPGGAEGIQLRVLSRDRNVHSAIRWFDSGEHPTLKVTTARGFSLTGSHNHPILTWVTNEQTGHPEFRWKLLSQLRIGDIAVIDRTSDLLWPSTKASLAAYRPDLGSRRVEIKQLPKSLDEDVAFILGALVAEGTVREHEIEFCNCDREWLQEFDERWQRAFPDCRLHRFARRPSSYGKKPYFTREIHARYVVAFLRRLGLIPVQSREKTVPPPILRSPRPVVAAFLRAYFEGDGSISSSGKKMVELSCVSVSEMLIDGLQILLLRFGIVSTKRFDRHRRIYKLYIRGLENYRLFQREVGFISKQKNDRLAAAVSGYHKEYSVTDFVPFISRFVRARLDQDQPWRGGREFALRNNFDRYGGLEEHASSVVALVEPQTQSETQILFDQLLETRYLFDPVTSIEDAGVTRVYSLKVESSCHSFVANGFINHNTEARLAPIAAELLADIDKDTVDFGPNFDGSLREPKILPAKVPNLLVNGSSGIAVGMATNIPSHNLGETVDALCTLIDGPDIELPALMRKIQGPDFPTGAIICGRDGIKDAYETGRGSVRIRAKAQVEQLKGNRQAIVVTELPYQVNKANLIESIAALVQDKKLEGISDLRDESDKDGMRIVIELKRDANDQIVLNQLFKHTTMETTFGIIMLALVDGRPRVLGLKPLLQAFADYRREVVIRRTRFELARAQDRAHILEGLKKALAHLDAVIKTIKQSKSPSEAKEALIKRFDFSEQQAQAILEMQLQRLTALERDKIDAEYAELLKKISYYELLLNSEQKVLELIKEELQELKKRFGDERRTEILGEVQDFKIEDLIADEDVVLTISHAGYIKRLPVSAYRKQRRGGVGVTAMETREEDFVEHLFVASTHETLLFFTTAGRCHWLKVHEVPQASRYAKGTAIVNLLSLQKEERLSTFVAVKAFESGRFLIMATKQGTIKKTELEAYANPRKAGIIAITLDKGDALIEAKITDGEREVLLITRQGKAIRFPEAQARDVGRSARGVRGIRLGKGDEVIAMVIAQPKAELLTVTTLGFGKRTPIEEHRLQSRGGKGIINIKVTKKNGDVVGAKVVKDGDEIMLISHEGMMVRCAVKDVRSTGRAAQGVRLINIKGKDRVASVAAVVPREKEEVNGVEKAERAQEAKVPVAEPQAEAPEVAIPTKPTAPPAPRKTRRAPAGTKPKAKPPKPKASRKTGKARRKR